MSSPFGRDYRVLLRQDPVAHLQKSFNILQPGSSFSSNWHYEHLAWKLTQVMRGQIRRLIITVPPRSGKSMLASISWPLFVLGHDPTRRILAISHTEGLAREFSLSRRTLILDPAHQAIFPRLQLTSQRPPDLELRTTDGGYIIAAGVGGAIHGMGADFAILDDPLKGLDAFSEARRRRVNEFYQQTLFGRLNDKQTAAIIIIMQRLHDDDLVGFVQGLDDWEVVSLPAIAIEDTVHELGPRPGDVYRRKAGEVLHEAREPRATLQEVRRAVGSLTFQTQYQQDPAPAGGHVIKRDWLRVYDEPPERREKTIVSWDTASTISDTADWSVGTVWAANGLNYYLLDVIREQLEAPELRRRIIDVSEHWEADATLIEATELGRALATELRRSSQLSPILRRPLYDKRARLEVQAVRFESGEVHLPREAPWLGAYVSELLAFPTGKHDDQVDSTSQALDWLSARAAITKPIVRRNITRRTIVRR